jgi:hypothetical protein
MPDLDRTMPDPKKRPRVARQRTLLDPSERSLEEKEMKPFKLPVRGLFSWWPVALGMGLGFLAPQLRDLLVPAAPWGMRLVFPFVLIAGRPEIGLSDELTAMLPQAMLFAQFPLEGLAVKFMLRRGTTVHGAYVQLAYIHLLCTLVLWLVSRAGA